MLTNSLEKGDISEEINRSHTDMLLEIWFCVCLEAATI